MKKLTQEEYARFGKWLEDYFTLACDIEKNIREGKRDPNYDKRHGKAICI